MVKQNSKRTEEKILDAAIKIFSQKGFSAATTSEIAKEANVAEGTIFRYFPKKKELLHGIVLRVIDSFGKKIFVEELQQVIERNSNESTEKIFKAIIMNRVKAFQKNFSYAKILFYEIQFHEDIRQIFIDKIAKNVIDIATEVLEEGKKRGDIKEIDSFVAFRSLFGMAIIMIMQRQFIPSENAFDNIEKEIEIIIDIFFNGVKVR